MNNVRILLSMLSSTYLPTKGCRHSLTLNDDDNVVVTIETEGRRLQFYLDKNDYDKSVTEIFFDIESEVARHKNSSDSYGSSL